MHTVVVGSKNPAKINAVREVFKDDFAVTGKEAPSAVSDQPVSDEETRTGAINRARYLVEKGAEIGIGLEGGVIDTEEEMLLCNWGSLATRSGDIYVAGGARIPLPEEIAAKVRNGEELGKVIDEYANQTDVRKGEGTIGILTRGMVSRSEMFSHVVKLLYGQFLYNEDFF
ncbi:DUF84 family protein [Alteribacter keqinensis]|uniref:Probable inosine/xanthosine triphosphatase n=1 Tax=Alteribacter keqinensis TaxID=2483800 RepID=A0A3M7TYN6_9BACI|nr:DUF84 family protein [Alteribacter keqinensis]RNA70391.1 DUF84 family protein [Alteribacter keqinensis]